MHNTTAKTMFGAAALALGFFALGSSSAHATTVDYYTEASIDGGTMSADPFLNYDLEGTLTDGISIAFTGIGSSISPASVNAPSSISLGDVDLSAFGTTATETFTAVTFDLEIFQTTPGSGNGTLVGDVNGEFTYNSATGPGGTGVPTLTFGSSSVVIEGVTYTLDYNPIQLVSPSTNDGVTSIQAYVTPGAATPEPVSMALVGAGLLGVGLLRRRKA